MYLILDDLKQFDLKAWQDEEKTFFHKWFHPQITNHIFPAKKITGSFEGYIPEQPEVIEPCDLQTIVYQILTGKTEWIVSSVITPVNTSTEDSGWVNFKVSFTNDNMTTSSHPTGAEAVWSSGTYTVGEDGKTIIRQDGIVMHLNPISGTNFTARFAIPTETTGLAGEYTFNMK